MEPAGELDKRIKMAIESLYEDESLRSQLSDEEAEVVLGWGEKLLESSGSAARQTAGTEGAGTQPNQLVERVRNAVREMNGLVGEKDRMGDPEVRASLGKLLSPTGSGSRALPKSAETLLKGRKKANGREFARQLVALVDEGWRMAGGSAGSPPSQSRGKARAGWLVLLAGLLLVVVVGAVAVWLLRGPSTTPSPAFSPGQQAASSKPTAGSWYQLYFTTPRYPDRVTDHKGSLDEKLAAFIAAAQSSVDMAIYQLDLEDVTQALLDAKKRGATVRVVTDTNILADSKENPSFKKLQAAGITVVGGNPNAIMHDKFVVVDGKAVWTGSWNFTENDTYRYNNNGIAIQSPDLAKNYTVTFEKMWRDQKFGAQRKPGGTTPRLTIQGTTVENYFAPEDNVSEKIANRLKNAEKTIDFMTFSFTDDNIGSTVTARSKAGVRVRGVFETTGSETRFSEYGQMKSAGMDVHQDGNPYLMHHKVFIIDGKTVIVGSFNISENAETSNDENLLIVDDPAMAEQFTGEFGRVYDQAKNPPSKKQDLPNRLP